MSFCQNFLPLFVLKARVFSSAGVSGSKSADFKRFS